MKIGLYGGSFDPIHCAHLLIAQFVLDELGLDRVVFIPSANPPHKKVYSDAEARLAMVNSAVTGSPGFSVSEIEARAGGPTFSVDTIAAFSTEHEIPREDLYWIIGSDNFVDLPTWKDARRILDLATLAVFPRNGVNFEDAQTVFKERAILLTTAPEIDISSTLIRSMVARGRSVRHFVPDGVAELIASKQLYL